MAMIVIVSGGFERRSSRIFRWEGMEVGAKFGGAGPAGSSEGVAWNMCCHVAAGVKCGACQSGVSGGDSGGSHEGGGAYGSVDIPEAVAAVEVVGDENLVFQRPVCADRDKGR